MATASEAELALAFVARRAGARSLPRSRWGHVLAFDLGWMNPGQARAYVDQAVAAGLFEEEGEQLRLRLDPHSVEVPRGFKPDPAHPVLASAAPAAVVEDPFLRRLDCLAQSRRQDRAATLAEVAALQERLGGLLDAEAALLWLDDGADAAAAAQEALSLRLKAAP